MFYERIQNFKSILKSLASKSRNYCDNCKLTSVFSTFSFSENLIHIWFSKHFNFYQIKFVKMNKCTFWWRNRFVFICVCNGSQCHQQLIWHAHNHIECFKTEEEGGDNLKPNITLRCLQLIFDLLIKIVCWTHGQ